MPEVSALRKHPCPECGGDAEWNAAKQALVCPYCGTVLPWSDGQDAFGTGIVEHDLEQALAAAPEATRQLRGEKTSVKCESCKAISIFSSERVAQKCDFCGSPSIVPVDDLRDAIVPESILPAVVPATKVRDLLRQWYGSRWFAPNKLKKVALTDTLHAIYIPYWTFDAHVSAQWTAESGYYYYETQSVRGSDGRMTTQQVRRTRWRPSSGSIAHFFDDDMVPGTVGVNLGYLRKIEPFPTLTDLKPYDPAYVRGWTVERYQVDLRQASTISKGQMDAAVQSLCAREVPGDTYRDLRVAADYRGRTFKHILVPIWLVTYTYGARTFHVIMNGYTGTIAGDHPRSWVKIALAVLAVLLLVALFVYFGQQQ